MTHRLFMLPYRKGSKSVENLLYDLEEAKSIRIEGSKYKSRTGDLVINWGRTEVNVDLSKAEVLNHPDNTRICSNKRRFFELMSEVGTDTPRVPLWTQNKEEVSQWIESGKVVFARTKVSGHSGDGIVVIETLEDLAKIADDTLFVLYVPKKSEFRLHFFKGEIFDFQKKARMTDFEEPNWRIRSHQNGFVYTRNDIEVPKDVTDQAQKCATVLSPYIDFGAIDVIYNQWRDEAYVLEVNTAPGLEGTTLTRYSEKFNGYWREFKNGK